MGALLIVTAVDNPPWEAGDIVTVIDAAKDPGSLIVPPNWVRVHVTNASVADAKEFLGPVRSLFDYEEINRTGAGVRIRVSIDAKQADKYGAEKGMREHLFQWLQKEYGALKHSSNPPYEYVVDIPDPDLDNAELKERFEDIAVEELGPSTFFFSQSDLEAALGAGGFMAVTKAQARDHLLRREDGVSASGGSKKRRR